MSERLTVLLPSPFQYLIFILFLRLVIVFVSKGTMKQPVQGVQETAEEAPPSVILGEDS